MVSRLDEIRRKKREEHRKKREEERRLQEEQRTAQEAQQPFAPMSTNENDGYSRVYGEFGLKWIKVDTDAKDMLAPTNTRVEMNGGASKPPPAARRSLDTEFRSSNGLRASQKDSFPSTRPSGPVSYVAKTAGASPLSDVTCSQPSPSKGPTKRSVSFTKPETVNENEPEEDPIMAIMRKLEAQKKNKQKVKEESPSAASHSSLAKNDPMEIQRRLSKETTMTDPLEIARINEEKKVAREKERETEDDSEEEEKKTGNESPKNPWALMERERRSLSPQAAERESRPRHKPTSDLWDDSDDEAAQVVTKKKKPAARKKSGETRKAAPKKKVGRPKQEPADDSDVDSEPGSSESENEKEETLIPSFTAPKLGPPAALEPLELPRGKDQSRSHQVPASINRYLRGYQQQGISFLYSCIMRDSGAILGDDMGLGKTVQLISLLASLFGKTGTGKDATELHRRRRLISKKLREIKTANDEALMFSRAPSASSDTREIEGLCLPEWAPVLVIVPPSVIDNWMNEFRTWGHFAVGVYQGKGREQAIEKVKNGTNEVLVCGSALATNHFEAMAEIPWKLLIVDEVHNYKNAATKAYKKLRELRDTCQCPIIGMTGTIMPNNHKELYNLIDLVSPGLLADWTTFKERFSGPILYARIKSADAETIQQSISSNHELDALLKKVYLTRTKEDELGDELPEKDETVLFCEPTEIQKTLYQHVLSLPDYELLRYSNSPCDCGVNRSIFEGYKRLHNRNERVEFLRRHKDDITRRKKCCYKIPENPNRESDDDPFILPNAVLWRFQHEEDEECEMCPYCVQFPAYNKLYKLSSHAALLLAERDPSSLVEGSQSWTDAAKDLAFARVAIPPDLLSELPGGSNPYVIQDGIMNDHAMLSGKMDKLDKLLRVFDQGANRVLLFSHYVKTLNLIQQFVQSRGYSFLRLDGQTSTPDRQKLVDRFQNDPTIFLFLMSTKAGGLGLNLTAANKVICFDLDFNPSYDEQAQDRAFRIGQTKDVQVIRLISQGTIEEQKYIRQIYKVHLKNDTIKSVQEDGTGQARLFRGVQGDKHRKGEIFGVENLLKFKDGSFMSDLWKSSESRPSSRNDDTVKVDELTNALTNFSEQQVDNIGGNLLEQDFDSAVKAQEVKDGDEEDYSKVVEGTTAINHQELFAPHQEDSDDDREEVLGGASQNMMAVLGGSDDDDDDDEDGDDEQQMPVEPPRDIRAHLDEDSPTENEVPKKRRAVATLDSIDEDSHNHVQFAAAVQSFPDEEDEFVAAMKPPPKKPKKGSGAEASNPKKRPAKASEKETATTFSTSDIALPDYNKSKKKKKKKSKK